MKTLLFTALFTLLIFSIGNTSENLSEFIMHHVGNSDSWHPIPLLPVIHLPSEIYFYGINMGISLHVLLIFFAAVVMLIFLPLSSKRKSGAPASLFGHAIEAIVIFIRDDLVVPNIGKKEAVSWLPFFLTLFFFILTMNLLGLIPGLATTTSNINCTAALAIMTFLAFNIAGMVKNGPFKYYFKLVPSGVPWPIFIILWPIELFGLCAKAFALAIRLFANMTAGHIVIFAFLGLISLFKSWIITPIPLSFALFIYLIEVLVAFLQAYVFTLLASLFIGMSIHQDH